MAIETLVTPRVNTVEDCLTHDFQDLLVQQGLMERPEGWEELTIINRIPSSMKQARVFANILEDNKGYIVPSKKTALVLFGDCQESELNAQRSLLFNMRASLGNDSQNIATYVNIGTAFGVKNFSLRSAELVLLNLLINFPKSNKVDLSLHRYGFVDQASICAVGTELDRLKSRLSRTGNLEILNKILFQEYYNENTDQCFNTRYIYSVKEKCS